MHREESIVVVGAGQAGARAVDTLRAAGFKGLITLIGDEPHLPYERPPLSKECLANEGSAGPSLINPREFYTRHAVTQKLGCRVGRIDPQARTIMLDDGARLPYSKLLLATGSRPRRLPALEGGAVPLTYLRTLDDARWLAPRLAPNTRVVVIGGGVIGMEVAASAVIRGCAVTVVEADARLMARCSTSAIADWVAKLHSERGVLIFLGRMIKVTGHDAQGGFALLDDGRRIPADLIVAGVGVLPNTELAEEAGLAVENGIAVDAHCRTSDPHIYAAGDVTNQFQLHLCRKARLESWANANDQAEAAAHHMLGDQTVRTSIPRFWSDQYDMNIQVAGDIDTADTVLRGDMNAKQFCLFHLRDGVVVGATSANAGRDMILARRLIERRTTVNRDTLADTGVNLRTLAV